MAVETNSVREALEPCSIHSYAQEYEFRCDDGGGYTPTEAERAMIEDAINGFLSEPRARTAYDAIGSGVKALEWEHHPQATGQVRAPSPWGTYRIVFFGDYALWGCRADGMSLGNKAASIDEAKAAAQADFERRVLSCLSTDTAAGAGPGVEAVAFEFDRYIDGTLMAEGVKIEHQPTLEKAFKRAAQIASRGANGEVPVLVLRSPLYTHPVEEPGEVERKLRERLEKANAERSQLLADIQLLRTEMATAVTDMQDRAERAETALYPFALEADEWADTVPDNHRSLCTEPNSETAHPGSETRFTVGDLRRARDLRAALTGDAQEAAK